MPSTSADTQHMSVSYYCTEFSFIEVWYQSSYITLTSHRWAFKIIIKLCQWRSRNRTGLCSLHGVSFCRTVLVLIKIAPERIICVIVHCFTIRTNKARCIACSQVIDRLWWQCFHGRTDDERDTWWHNVGAKCRLQSLSPPNLTDGFL